jgi:hypothetical protein
MFVTVMKASRPDVELRLTAEEADLLKLYFGNLARHEIYASLDDAGVEEASEKVTQIHILTNAIYNELEALRY